MGEFGKPAAVPAEGELGTILLVDDEPALLTLVSIVLTKRGYRVLEAANGRQALDIYRREQGPIDLVLLDVKMPGLSGPETLRQLRAIDPAVRVVFTSGAHGNTLTDEDRAQSLGFFAKPFRLNELADAIGAVLEGARAAAAIQNETPAAVGRSAEGGS
jgi:DNA-binding response OmpR family regulator